MRKMVSMLCLILALAPVAARAQEVVAKTVLSGNEARIFAPFSIKSDCTSAVRPDVRIVTAPSHGRVRTDPTRQVVDLPRTVERSRCNGKQVEAIAVYYRPEAGFVGDDTVVIESDFRNGNVKRFTAIITVAKEVPPGAQPSEAVVADVLSGNETRVLVPHSLKADCTSDSLPDVRISQQPVNGTARIETIQLPVLRQSSDVLARCNGQTVDAAAVYYKARDGFVGDDKMVVEIDFKTGSVRRTVAIIHVR